MHLQARSAFRPRPTALAPGSGGRGPDLPEERFQGHPLRKDFPMTGFVEVRYSDALKRIVYEKVSLPQEYRIFTLENS